MEPVSTDHHIKLTRGVLCELNLRAVRGLSDSLNGIAKKQLDVPEMVPQDLAQGTANDLDIFANPMPKFIPAHPENLRVCALGNFECVIRERCHLGALAKRSWPVNGNHV